MMEKRVLITGGTKGIGRAVAECLAKAGYSLILTYASDKEEALRVADGCISVPHRRAGCLSHIGKSATTCKA